MPVPRQVIKLAYGSIPKDCGTFTFYRNLRESLQAHGIEVFCVSVGQHEARQWNADFADDHCVLLAARATDPRAQAKAFVDWARHQQIDLVMPINSTALLSALPHLPREIQAVMRCANAFDHGYLITVLNQDWTASIVGTTPRHMKDLETCYGAEARKLTLIPHGINPEPYQAMPARCPAEILQLGFLGRLEHLQKGALYLPGIVQRLEDLRIPFKLKIAGAGEHRGQMEGLMKSAVLRGSVEFVGRLVPQEIPGFFAGVDVFLFPSRFEGFGFALVEAMMAGSVPVVSRIGGITDFIIEGGKAGLLCDIGDEGAFAEAVARLHKDRSLLASLSAAAAKTARERFNDTRMAAEYAQLFQRLVTAPLPKRPPVPWAQFRMPAALRPNWRSRLPRPFRRFARGLQVRWAKAAGLHRNGQELIVS